MGINFSHISNQLKPNPILNWNIWTEWGKNWVECPYCRYMTIKEHAIDFNFCPGCGEPIAFYGCKENEREANF